MEFTIKKGKIFKKAGILIAVIVFLFYLGNAFILVNNRSNASIENITWRSLDNGDFKFKDKIATWYTTTVDIEFTYEFRNGFIIAEREDMVMEFLQLKGGRLFNVTLNTIYYHEDLLR